MNVLRGCTWQRSGPLWTSASRGILQHQQRANSTLFIQVNSTLEKAAGMPRGLKDSIFWLFERLEIGQNPPQDGIQVFSHSHGEACDTPMPELRSSWENLRLSVAGWGIMRFFACQDIQGWSQIPMATDEPQGKVYRKPFEACTSDHDVWQRDWSKGIFFAEEWSAKKCKAERALIPYPHLEPIPAGLPHCVFTTHRPLAAGQEGVASDSPGAG